MLPTGSLKCLSSKHLAIKITNVSCLYIKPQVLTKPEVIEQRFNFSLPSDYQAIFGQGTKKRGQITKIICQIMSNYLSKIILTMLH